ncbi:hypothetical protein AAH991_00560 [Microbispora sp. ZYX-F-249]|uniref:UDP-N-acetylglucosamine 2-epimerase domain-containing protein n=1 Tax=Microbispora maris TaxID=3144104 RepID=A0ABV0AEP2_9ACTN
MKAVGQSALGLVRSGFEGQPSWALVGEGALATMRAEQITTRDLEALPLDSGEVREEVNRIMGALETYGAHLAATPGGAGWLYVQHVPVRRLVERLVRKLMALSAWEPFKKAPGAITLAPYEGLVGVRSSSSREYRSYTVTWSGVAFVLGAPVSHNPLRSAQSPTRPAVHVAAAHPPASEVRRSDVVALSWSSRHAATLLPVLDVLARDGRRSLLIDLATDAAERSPAPRAEEVRLYSPPAGLFGRRGAVEELRRQDDGAVVQVKEHSVHLGRLLRLVSVLLETSGGCTQPSWRSVVEAEAWLDDVLAVARPHAVLVSNDTSPLGALAVHAAERHGINTVHVQHGAWTAESVAWPALHSRHIVVMGERDAPLARAWTRHPDAEVHVLGQPRFDSLARCDREAQQRYLAQLIDAAAGREPTRIVVWACQPFGPDRLRAQADLLLDGLRRADGGWGLVIAPHPAQSADAFSALVRRDDGALVAVTDPRVGARGCFAGADALASAYSTCGIEAALLNVPVLEIGAAGERTLGLAEHGLARRCISADDIADALSSLARPNRPAVQTTPDAVCRWRGDSAADVAHLILGRADDAATRLVPIHHDAPGADSALSRGEGARAR